MTTTAPSIPKVKLNNGVEIPIIGSGAYAPPAGLPQVKSWILTALEAGYRHIDTAFSYRTEVAVGEAVREFLESKQAREEGLTREDVFVTTKLPWNRHDNVAKSFEESLKNLGLGYIDLYLMHWPNSFEYDETTDTPRHPDGSLRLNDGVNFSQSWAEMEKLLGTGKVRAIGVSNFSIKNLEILFKTAKIVPAVNQVELHPYLSQEPLRSYCAEKGIVLEAYTPSGYSTVRSDPLINELAKKYGPDVTPNQVTLSWHVKRSVVIVPKSADPGRQRENLKIIDLSDEDVEAINKLDKNTRLCNKPDEKGMVWGWTMERLGWD